MAAPSTRSWWGWLAAAGRLMPHRAWPLECRYDSEEDRYQARQQQMHRSSQLRGEAARQMGLLSGYRERQAAQGRVRDGALRSKLLQQGLASGSGADDDRGLRFQADPCSCTAASQLQQLAEQERRWEALDAAACAAGPGGDATPAEQPLLCYASIPWPSQGGAAYLLALAELELGGKPGPGQEPPSAAGPGRRRALRRAYARACLRWHPDKFQQQWGRALAPGDSERVQARVQAVAQGINDAWAELQAQGGGEESGPG